MEFSNDEVKMANEYLKKLFRLFNNQMTANQTTLEFHLTPIRMAILKPPKCWKGHVEK
jgi:hypothetical protein